MKFTLRLKRCCDSSIFHSFRLLIVVVALLILLIINVGLSRLIRNLQEVFLPTSHNCLADPPNCGNFDGVKLLSVDYIEPSSNSIFFLEDHNHNFISPRVLCAAESAATTNSDRQIFILTTSSMVYNTPALLEVLAARNNLHLGYFNPAKIFNGTPLYQWYRNESWKKSNWPTYHFSDAIRWLMLWLYGGIYMDTDVILMRKLPNSSFVGLESDINLGAGAIGLPPKHQVLTKCINEIADNYDPTVWGSVGPILLTKALLDICGKETLKQPSKICPDITVLGIKSFYPIPWENWRQYFDSRKRKHLFEDEHIYGLHVWNVYSKHEVVNLKKPTPYTIAAKRFCPAVVRSVKNKM